MRVVTPSRVFCADPVPGGVHKRRPAVAVQAQPAGTGLQRELEGAAVLPVPADGRLRGLRLGLDHRAQTVRGQLLFRRVSHRVPAEERPLVPHAAHQQDGHVPGHRAVLRAPQAVRPGHAVLRPGVQDHLPPVARHGGGQVRVQLSRRGPLRAAAAAVVTTHPPYTLLKML